MTKLSTQFHALPSELPELLSNVLDDPSIAVVLGSNTPLRLQAWSRDMKPFNVEEHSFVAFALKPPSLDAQKMSEFIDRNPGLLFLHVGKLTPKGLNEAWLSSMTDDDVAMKRWQSAARYLRRRTMTGAIAVHPVTGASSRMRAHRFSTGAQRLYANGVPILPFAGHCLITLPAPDSKGPSKADGTTEPNSSGRPKGRRGAE